MFVFWSSFGEKLVFIQVGLETRKHITHVAFQTRDEERKENKAEREMRKRKKGRTEPHYKFLATPLSVSTAIVAFESVVISVRVWVRVPDQWELVIRCVFGCVFGCVY